jgi:hypothetical protein
LTRETVLFVLLAALLQALLAYALWPGGALL